MPRAPKTFGELIADLVRTTRINIPGVGMPLAGRLLDTLGVAKGAAGPVALGVTVAQHAFDALSESVKEATARLNELGEAARISGGTPGQIAGLTAMGIPAGQIAGMAARLRHLGSTDPFAMQELSNAGTRALPRPFGSGNEATLLQTAFEHLRILYKTRGEEAALIAARNLEMESMMKYVVVSDRVAATTKRLAEATQKMAGPMGQMAANDLDVKLEQWNQALSNFKTFIGTIPMLAFSQWITNWTESLINFTESLRQAFSNLGPGQGTPNTNPNVNLMKDIIYGLYSGAMSVFGPRLEDALGVLAKALGESTSATKQNTNQLRAWQEGMFGGADLARSAIGSGMQGEFLRRSIRGDTLRLGGLGV